MFQRKEKRTASARKTKSQANNFHRQNQFSNSKISTDEWTDRSSFYGWFFGYKPLSQGVWLDQRKLAKEVKEAIRKTAKIVPIKLTLEVSHQGLRLVQPYLLVNNHRKVKTVLVKRRIAADLVQTCTLGCVPYHDFVVLVRALENGCCDLMTFRCDSPETAFMLHSLVEKLILLPQKRTALHLQLDEQRGRGQWSADRRPPLSLRTRTLYRLLVAELKEKFQNQKSTDHIYDTVLKNTGVRPSSTKTPFRRFGDSFREKSISDAKQGEEQRFIPSAVSVDRLDNNTAIPIAAERSTSFTVLA
ncbi:hypothetical protein T11_11285 [Trichinella zimbabwensis]|uniref:PID domain-containing protein n=1 Tax=Trichinella zimbabwensis TaxID=268475 RepID=A0A0V1HTF1_9BILA|nr:hypothetical protein T11_11285 [Trichinella zimbabwensis]